MSIVVAYAPGAGVWGSASERLPTLHTLNQNDALRQGCKAVAFSISASEHKLWVLRNLLGKIAATSFSIPNLHPYDYFQDEGTRAGAFGVWDALVDFLHTRKGEENEDVMGLVKAWAGRLRDPSEQQHGQEDLFKKNTEGRKFKISEVFIYFLLFFHFHIFIIV